MYQEEKEEIFKNYYQKYQNKSEDNQKKRYGNKTFENLFTNISHRMKGQSKRRRPERNFGNLLSKLYSKITQNDNMGEGKTQQTVNKVLDIISELPRREKIKLIQIITKIYQKYTQQQTNGSEINKLLSKIWTGNQKSSWI